MKNNIQINVFPERKEHELMSEIDISNEIEDLLEVSVPKNQKYKEWRKKIDEEDLDKENLLLFLTEIENYLKKLNDFQQKKFKNSKETDGFISEDFSGLNEDLKKESVRKIRAVAQEALAGNLSKIGFGMSAGVFISEKYPEYCYKIITNPDVYEKNCNVQEECDFLSEMLKIKIDGVRVPKPYYYYMDENVHMYVMENLKAVTLADLESGNAKLPENFDAGEVAVNLRRFFELMHGELKLYHRDFHNKNLMIDELGLPCVIDPGKAKHQMLNGEEMYRAVDNSIGTRDIYINDNIELEKHISSLRKLTINKEEVC